MDRRVVLVHGFTQDPSSWDHGGLADRLGGTALALPGHGGRAPVSDLWTAARDLGERGGRGAYVGYSLGGRLCLHLALAQPATVETLVLLGATPGIEHGSDRAARRAADDELAATIECDGVDAFLERWLANPLFASLPRSAAGLEGRRRNTAGGLAGALRTMGTGVQDDLWPRLGELRMPVLVVAGQRDLKFGAIGARMARAIGDNAAFATVPGAGHAAHLECPDAFVDIVQDFLSSH